MEVSWSRGVNIYEFAFEMMRTAHTEPFAVMGIIAGAAALDPEWAKRFVETFCPLKEGKRIEEDENNLRHLITHLDPELPESWRCAEHDFTMDVDSKDRIPENLRNTLRKMFDQGLPG